MSTGPGFAHLHLHTEYSMLDGIARHKELMAAVTRLGMTHAAMTDHGNMFGAYSFYQAAKEAGVTPILGIEAYVAPHDRHVKKPAFWGNPGQRADDVSAGGAYTHMTLLAVNAVGLRNLFRLSSLASIEGRYHKPRMDRELLAQYSEGIVATTGCPSGEVQTRLRLDQDAEALQAAADYRDIFGADNYFVEVMDHGLDLETRTRDGLSIISKKLDLPMVLTNDAHYVHQADAATHDAMLCVNSGSKLTDEKRFRFAGDGYYLKSPAEMRALGTEMDAAADTTLLIAERIEPYDEVFAPVFRMPDFPVPEGETQYSWLVKETWAGMHRRFPDGIPEVHRDRVEYELSVIKQMGFPSYFLVTADIVNYAKTNGYRIAPGRGSATGCDVAYALRITDLDPIEHKLIFERFLNPERVTMPDIDLDFDERHRDKMVRYVTGKYGSDRVCQIMTFGTLKAKAAIKDSARVDGAPFAESNALTKAMPAPVMGNDIPLSGVYDKEHPRYGEAEALRQHIANTPGALTIFNRAAAMEGLIRQVGVHACGIILADVPILDVIPVWRRDTDGAIVTGFDYPSCEDMGLLKMDFLGLRNLTVIDDAVRFVREMLGDPTFDVAADRLEDRLTYEMLARGDTLGVFQLDGDQIRALLRLMAPTGFDDIAAVLALYRPGPMAANAHLDYAERKNGRQPITAIHPELAEPLAEILDPTYGLIVFQEQVLAIAQKVAGYSLGRADLLRRAMGKKKKKILDQEYEGFAAGMTANGYSPEAIKTLWDILLPFAGYAFNRSHTAGYGIISFWTAYLKANYPVQFMAALLTSVGDDKNKMAVYLAECRRMGITVLPPDVNASAGEFTPVDGRIRFGLNAIRNVGQGVVNAIVAGRAGGAYQSFEDFLQKVDAVVCNKKTIESLIKAGAFDGLGHTRLSLIRVYDQAIAAITPTKKGEAAGQFDLFSSLLDDAPAAEIVGLDLVYTDEEWDQRVLLGFEREMLGLYVSGHPLAGAERTLRRHCDTSVAALLGDDVNGGRPVQLAGMLSNVVHRTTKAGKRMLSATLEDLDGSIELLVFPALYETVGAHLANDLIVSVKGRTNKRDDEDPTTVAATDIMILDVGDAPAETPLVITVEVLDVNETLVGQLRDVIVAHPGKTPLQVLLRCAPGRSTRLAVRNFRVDDTPGLRGELKALKVGLQ